MWQKARRGVRMSKRWTRGGNKQQQAAIWALSVSVKETQGCNTPLKIHLVNIEGMSEWRRKNRTVTPRKLITNQDWSFRERLFMKIRQVQICLILISQRLSLPHITEVTSLFGLLCSYQFATLWKWKWYPHWVQDGWITHSQIRYPKLIDEAHLWVF